MICGHTHVCGHTLCCGQHHPVVYTNHQQYQTMHNTTLRTLQNGKNVNRQRWDCCVLIVLVVLMT